MLNGAACKFVYSIFKILQAFIKDMRIEKEHKKRPKDSASKIVKEQKHGIMRNIIIKEMILDDG